MRKLSNIRWKLVVYDLLMLTAVDLLLLVFSGENLSAQGMVVQITIGMVIVFATRLLGSVYSQIWRYGGIQCYIRLVLTDVAAFIVIFVCERALVVEHITFVRLLAISSMNLLGTLLLRMFYRYAFKCGNDNTAHGRFLLTMSVNVLKKQLKSILQLSVLAEWESAWRKNCLTMQRLLTRLDALWM